MGKYDWLVEMVTVQRNPKWHWDIFFSPSILWFFSDLGKPLGKLKYLFSPGTRQGRLWNVGVIDPFIFIKVLKKQANKKKLLINLPQCMASNLASLYRRKLESGRIKKERKKDSSRAILQLGNEVISRRRLNFYGTSEWIGFHFCLLQPAGVSQIPAWVGLWNGWS